MHLCSFSIPKENPKLLDSGPLRNGIKDLPNMDLGAVEDSGISLCHSGHFMYQKEDSPDRPVDASSSHDRNGLQNEPIAIIGIGKSKGQSIQRCAKHNQDAGYQAMYHQHLSFGDFLKMEGTVAAKFQLRASI